VGDDKGRRPSFSLAELASTRGWRGGGGVR
jgi:hypothetical protein